MPIRVIEWVHEAARWAPLAPLMAVLAVAVIEAIVLPARPWAKGAWLLAAVGCGTLASAAAIWQQHQKTGAAAAAAAAGAAATDEQLGALRGLWTQWEAIAQSLPPPAGAKPAASFATEPDAIASLSAEVASIKGQIEASRATAKGRAIDADTAAKLALYLRQFGPHRVVVSCVPNDVEAYTYANQLANILRIAGWDALGPEISGPEIGGNESEAAAIAVNLYVRDPRSPDAAKILVDAFTRFNIPYQSGIAPSEAIPDAATAELHVAKKP